eukprot:4887503-Amphidinium_carterae.1
MRATGNAWCERRLTWCRHPPSVGIKVERKTFVSNTRRTGYASMGTSAVIAMTSQALPQYLRQITPINPGKVARTRSHDHLGQ